MDRLTRTKLEGLESNQQLAGASGIVSDMLNLFPPSYML
jgi:hypothetical protein